MEVTPETKNPTTVILTAPPPPASGEGLAHNRQFSDSVISDDFDDDTSRASSPSTSEKFFETREYDGEVDATRPMPADIAVDQSKSFRASSMKDVPNALTLLNIDNAQHEHHDEDADTTPAANTSDGAEEKGTRKSPLPGDPLFGAFSSVFGWTQNPLMTHSQKLREQKRVTSAKLAASSLHASLLRQKVVVSTTSSPLWCIAVSPGGQYIATGGQDTIVKIWAIQGSFGAKHMEATFSKKAASKTETQQQTPSTTATPTTNTDSPSLPTTEPGAAGASMSVDEPSQSTLSADTDKVAKSVNPSDIENIVYPRPYRTYSGHTLDIIDLSWSSSHFLLSASIDSTVRLWHVARNKCLRIFKHPDFVTAVAFHPLHDRLFISGSFDRIIRLYDIPEHRVVQWTQTPNIITSAAFTPQTGDTVVAGLIDGRVALYHTDDMKYVTQIECRNRSGKDKRGTKVTSITFDAAGRRMLITTNDSRMRLYSTTDYLYLAKFKGNVNNSLQIRGEISADARTVICGSENGCVYSWNTPLQAIPSDTKSSGATLHTTLQTAGNANQNALKVKATDSLKVNNNIVTATAHLTLPTAHSPTTVTHAPPVMEHARTIIVSLSFDGIMYFHELPRLMEPESAPEGKSK